MKLKPITEKSMTQGKIVSSEFLTELCKSTLELYKKNGAFHPWLGYLAEIDGNYVGTCAFKNPPGEKGVEIAYFTFPDYEGLLIATQMVKELITIALNSQIADIFAYTLPEMNASSHILEKLGFVNAGIVQHPEDGEVREWKYALIT